MPHSPAAGFTLAELLIALALLGVLATFAIPQVLQGLETQQNKTKLRELVAVYSDLAFDGYNQGILFEGASRTSIANYLLSRLNPVKVCPTNGRTQGCWSHTNALITCNPNNMDKTVNGTFVLHNGVVVAGLHEEETSSNGSMYVQVDLNGEQGPNERNKDQWDLIFRMTPRMDLPTKLGLSFASASVSPCFAEDRAAWNALF